MVAKIRLFLKSRMPDKSILTEKQNGLLFVVYNASRDYLTVPHDAERRWERLRKALDDLNLYGIDMRVRKPDYIPIFCEAFIKVYEADYADPQLLGQL